MSEPKTKFQQLLQELFQFDLADLDFGIYRIMNYKRQVIERWIQNDLPQTIAHELNQDALAAQEEANKALKEIRHRVQETLGTYAIDTEGNLDKKYVNTPLGKAYLEARQKAAHAQSSQALEAAVYNHLYAFFGRYYQDGDFISKRRYSRKERYAIPYNGEEVYLYWANHDQYYIKTAEHFTDYTWKAPNGVTVHFKLKAADVEQNNVKGEKRFFLPVLDAITWEAVSPLPAGEGSGVRDTLTIPFEYRPLTPQEEKVYGAKNQQEAILKQAIQDISARLTKNAQALTALTAERRKDAKGQSVSYLEHHLRQYTARNTRDFFIHKDLRGFLSRELDFYLKNEVLNLDELEAAGEGLAAGWFQLMRLIKRVGNAIIDFLAQIEEFQKALWEKKKFITETFYCITVGNIPEDFYPEIVANNAQWEEWRRLFHIHELPKDLLSGDPETREGRLAFLKAHPSLVLDTRHFPQDFTDRLLAAFANLDEATDGLLIHSENWQALNLLQEKYRERVKCIYIDPPYNTGSDDFIYRDNYQHSSWLSMMVDRLAVAREWLMADGGLFVSIDYNEDARLRIMLEELFGERQYRNTIVPARVKKSIMERERVRSLNWGTGYLMFFAASENTLIVPPVRHLKSAKKEKWHSFDAPGIRPTMEYELFGQKPPSGRHWMYSQDRALQMVDRGELRQNSKTGRIEYKVPESEGILLDTNWTDLLESDSDWDFLTEKNTSFLQRVFTMLVSQSDYILDFFAGSGTTGHAVINLNREDDGRRKFILVEMANYFDTVLLPRLKKVTFSPEWKDGKPKRMATQEEFKRGPRIIKVIRLESYEDALNNIAFDEASRQQALALFRDDYLLLYMLRWESRKSETFLDVEKLQSPFSYCLHIHRDGETRVQPVDLPETFNYLLGLDVQTRQVLPSPAGRGGGGEGRYLVYRGTLRNGRKAIVLWRETQSWTTEDYERDAAFVAEQNLTDGADDIFVNGDSCIPGAQSLDGLFKARLFGGKEV